MVNYSKYKAIRTEVDGLWFASKKEAKRYRELVLLEKAGAISHLELQPIYEINYQGVKICRYQGDFRYFCKEKRARVLEDVKGMKTPVYRLKKKLVEAFYPGTKIVEV
jgi:hypothetical protein